MVVVAKSLVALAMSSGIAQAFDFTTLMKLQAMKSQFTRDKIGDEQKVALMEHAGFNDMELFMSKQIDANEFKLSMKQQMKDKLIQNILNGGGLDLNNPWVRKSMFGDQDSAEMFTRTTPEPMQSIMRLLRSEDTGKRLSMTDDEKAKAKAYGKELLKKYQFKQFNTPGSSFTENFDEILLATGDDRKTVIKQIIEESMFETIQDPIDRTLMYYLTQRRKSGVDKADIDAQIKSLQTIKIFQGSVPASSPVTEDNLFAFYRMVDGKVEAADILNVALGDQLGPISELDFERYFGAPAKQFSCRAHRDVLKVPCGIKYKADECVAAGCCYLPDAPAGEPKCFHDLYGKIGSGLLRRAYVKGDAKQSQAIEGLFPGNVIPSLDLILRDQTPYGAKLNDASRPANSAQYNVVQHPTGGRSWWQAASMNGMFEAGPNGANSHPNRNNAVAWANGNPIEPNRPRYGRPGYVWKPHGPTQSPFFDNMPGINPTANPLTNGLGTLDEYYRIWLEFAESQDQAQCALIHPSARVKCMDNYDALFEKATNNPANRNKCKDAGCCFNEDSFLEGGPACYRATDYGTCINLPADHVRTECGYEGITESECLTNVRCCYRPSADRKDPWCFYKFSNTLDENQWCSAWSQEQYRNVERKECFVTKNADVKTISFLREDAAHPASNVNNLVSQAQCEAAGCCYDSTLAVDVLEWMNEGLGLDRKIFRCFEKKNPQLADAWGTNAGGQKLDDTVLVNEALKDVTNSADCKANPNDAKCKKAATTYIHRRKTCDATKWGALKSHKRSCGENLSYYQCVYVNKCCFKPTVANEPACYRPEITADFDMGNSKKVDNTAV